jgi:cytoskeletal protein RodZ
MAQYHTHDAPTTTVVDDSSSSTAFVVALGVVVVGFLIWLFAFSGLLFDNDTNDAPPAQPNVEQNFEQNAPQENTAPQQDSGTSGGAPADQPTG